MSSSSLAEVESLRARAAALAAAHDYDESIACWAQIEQLEGDSGEAARAMARLAIEKCRRRNPLVACDAIEPQRSSETESPLTPQPLPPAVVASLGQILPSDGFKRTPIQQLELAIRERPSIPDFYLHLVPLYLEKGRDYDAERLLAKGRDDTGNDPRVAALWEDVAMLRMANKIELTRKEVEQHPSEQGTAALSQLHRDRDNLEIGIFTARAEREPDRPAVRYELGKRLKRADKPQPAIQSLEAALIDPAIRALAAFELADCYEHERQWAQALKYFRLAADSALRSQTELRKQALRAATDLAIRRKLGSAAQRYVSELELLDPHDSRAVELRRRVQRLAQPSEVALPPPTDPNKWPPGSPPAAGRNPCPKP